MGGLVPKKYFMNNKESSEIVSYSHSDATKKHLKLAPGSKEQLELNIENPNSILR